MSYKQSKNPFKSSPLNHNLRDKRTGTNYNHFHDPKNASRIYTSDQKVISGSSKFGTQSGRVIDDITGKRMSEEDYAREYARQLSSAYNSGQLNEGQFLADDLFKRNRKLSLKKGKLKLGSKYKGIDKGKMFNLGYGKANEDGSYTVPETQYTEDQIYDMMVQGGGLVSIVDGQIVAGNPNEATGQGFDKKNRIRIDDKFEDQYEEGTQEEFEEQQRLSNMSIEDRKLLIQEEIRQRKNKEAAELAERKAAIEARIEARRNESNSPVNNNSPLHQEIDQVSGEALEDYDYVSGEPVDVVTTEEVFGPDGVTVIGTNEITTTTTNQQGTRPQPTPTPTPTPANWKDCFKNGVFQTGATVGEGPNKIKCEMAENPPIPTPPETPEDLTHSYDDITTNTVFTPVETPPVETPEPEPNLFNLSGGSIKKQGFQFTLPQLERMSLPQLRRAQKNCGNCKSAGLINVLLGRRSG